MVRRPAGLVEADPPRLGVWVHELRHPMLDAAGGRTIKSAGVMIEIGEIDTQLQYTI